MRCTNVLVYRLVGNNVGDDFRPCWQGLWQAILHRWMPDKCLLAWTHQPPWNVRLRVGNRSLWKHLLCKGTARNVWREKQQIRGVRRGPDVWKLWQVANALFSFGPTRAIVTCLTFEGRPLKYYWEESDETLVALRPIKVAWRFPLKIYACNWLTFCDFFCDVILSGSFDISLFTGVLDALQKLMTATKMITA